jgi:hypothetical protein
MSFIYATVHHVKGDQVMWTGFYEWLFPEPQPATEEAAGWLAGELSKPISDLRRDLHELIGADEDKKERAA